MFILKLLFMASKNTEGQGNVQSSLNNHEKRLMTQKKDAFFLSSAV